MLVRGYFRVTGAISIIYSLMATASMVLSTPTLVYVKMRAKMYTAATEMLVRWLTLLGVVGTEGGAPNVSKRVQAWSIVRGYSKAKEYARPPHPQPTPCHRPCPGPSTALQARKRPRPRHADTVLRR